MYVTKLTILMGFYIRISVYRGSMEKVIQEAIEFAKEKHYEPTRFGADFSRHFMSVYQNVKNVEPNNLDLQVAALLHDTIEDTYTSQRELKDVFGEKVASLVVEMTDAETFKRELGKTKYLKRKLLYLSDAALTIKLADRLTHVLFPYGLDVDEAVSRPEVASKLNFRQTREALEYLQENRELNASHKELIRQHFNACAIIELKLAENSKREDE